jgi:hypothetical protein
MQPQFAAELVIVFFLLRSWRRQLIWVFRAGGGQEDATEGMAADGCLTAQECSGGMVPQIVVVFVLLLVYLHPGSFDQA